MPEDTGTSSGTTSTGTTTTTTAAAPPSFDPQAIARLVAAEVTKSSNAAAQSVTDKIVNALKPATKPNNVIHQTLIDAPDALMESVIKTAEDGAIRKTLATIDNRNQMNAGLEPVFSEFPALRPLEASIISEVQKFTSDKDPVSKRFGDAARSLAAKMGLVPVSQDKNVAAVKDATMSPTTGFTPTNAAGVAINPLQDSKSFIAERRAKFNIVSGKTKPAAA